MPRTHLRVSPPRPEPDRTGLGFRRGARLAGVLAAAAAAVPLGAVAALGGRPWAARAWCRLVARSLALRVRRVGPPLPPGALVVANHVGYLDIVALGAALPGRFLAMSEIARWPALGWIARRGGAVFIDRDSARNSHALLAPVAAALRRGERVVLFPEAGVSADGRSLGAFRPMLFQAGVDSGRPVVPVAVRYLEPSDPGVWAWLDGVGLWEHLWGQVLAQPRLGVEVRVGEPLRARPGEDRKALARRTRRAVAGLLALPPAAGAG